MGLDLLIRTGQLGQEEEKLGEKGQMGKALKGIILCRYGVQFIAELGHKKRNKMF